MIERAPERHVFLQHVHDGALHEIDQRHGEEATSGRVLEASYMDGEPGPLARLARWITGRAAIELSPPFTARGGDALGLFDGPLEPEALRVGGRVVCLEPRATGDEIVVRDFWARDVPAPWRVADAVDFAVVPGPGDEHEHDVSAMIVTLRMAPLVVARPVETSSAAVLDRMGSRARQLVAASLHGADAEGLCVTVREGDHVEVLAIPGEAIDDVARIQVGSGVRALPIQAAREGGYRSSAARRAMRIADEPGFARRAPRDRVTQGEASRRSAGRGFGERREASKTGSVADLGKRRRSKVERRRNQLSLRGVRPCAGSRTPSFCLSPLPV